MEYDASFMLIAFKLSLEDFKNIKWVGKNENKNRFLFTGTSLKKL